MSLEFCRTYHDIYMHPISSCCHHILDLRPENTEMIQFVVFWNLPASYRYFGPSKEQHSCKEIINEGNLTPSQPSFEPDPGPNEQQYTKGVCLTC